MFEEQSLIVFAMLLAIFVGVPLLNTLKDMFFDWLLSLPPFNRPRSRNTSEELSESDSAHGDGTGLAGSADYHSPSLPDEKRDTRR
jgi:hypothetical protein